MASYVTVTIAPIDGQARLPITVAGFTGIGEYPDPCVRTDAGWKIKSREFNDVFTVSD